MGRGRYDGRDHWHDEDGFEGRSSHDPDRDDDRYIYEDEDEARPPRRRAREAAYPPRRTRSPGEREWDAPPPPVHGHYPRRVRARRRRSVWPALLGGCALGVFLVVLAAALVVVFAIRNLQGGGTIANIPGIISTKPFSKEETQALPGGPFSQILVCDQVGNVTLHVDPTINKATMAIKKTVRAANQTDANKALQQIAIEVQPPNTITHPLTCARSQVTPSASASASAVTPPLAPSPTPSTGAASGNTGSASAAGSTTTALTVNVVFPGPDTFNHSVDLNITLPPSSLASDNGPSLSVNVEAPVGDIDVDGLSGMLNIRGGTGNVSVKHAILVDGSHIETAQGNVTFNGFLAVPPADSGVSARYLIQSEHNVDVTLPANTNVTLDANTNVGKIMSDFPITPTDDNGAMSYHGPLNATATVKPMATLVLDVSTGNVTIHKA